MTASLPQPIASSPEAEPEGLVLRSSPQLARVPPARPPLAIPEANIAPPSPGGALAGHQVAQNAGALSEPWLLIGLAALAGAGWILERRRRRRLETEKDSILWADVQTQSSSIITTTGELDVVVTSSSRATSPAHSMHLTALTETGSRREATLIDLQQLNAKLKRRRARGDLLAAAGLLQRHLADFRYTSPWVFLELRELHLLLDRAEEWEAARELFRSRFGQKAPVWQAPSTADVQLANDEQLCAALIAQWPYREARMVILHLLLGDPVARQQGYGPPPLALGVARDLLFLDRLLDGLMMARPPSTDFLL